MKYRLLWMILKLFSLLCRLLPYRGRQYLGRFFGRMGYKLTDSRRKVAGENLARAFPEMADEEIEVTVKDMFTHLGYTLVEFFRIYKLAEGIDNYVEIENREYLEEAYERGKGVIIYTAHFGNWEWLGCTVAAMGYPLVAVARRQKDPIHDMVERIRETTGAKIIYRNEGSLRDSLLCLKRGECLYLIGDQEARARGWKMNFFGRPASTFKGPVKLAARTGAAIVPVFTIRKDLEKHKLVCKKPVYVDSDAGEKEQKEILQRLTEVTENVISENRPQWMWLHRRWKTFS